MGKVSFFEHPSYRVAKWVTSKEAFEVANTYGDILEEVTYPHEILGLVIPRPPKIVEKSRLFRKPMILEEKTPGIFIGTISFGRPNETTWHIDVYGREYIDQLKDFAQRLADAFEVDVTIDLSQEYAKREHSI